MYEQRMKSVDEILLEGLKRGDRDAQRELYERYAPALLATAMRYSGERSVAEDLLHDALIKIFGSISTFNYRGEGSLRAWMSRIVVNVALSHLRSQGREPTVALDRLGELSELREPPPPPESIPREVLLGFIAELPAGYRTVFNLFCIEGHSHKQIAEELGIAEKSSSSQLLRAKRMLATKINSYRGRNE